MDIDRSESRERHLQKAPKEDLLHVYDVTVWEPRTPVDKLCELPFRVVPKKLILGIVFMAVAFLLLSSTALAVLEEPVLGGFVAVSVVPALLLAWYFWMSDPYERVTATTLAVTYLLGCMMVSVAAVVNTAGQDALIGFTSLGVYLFFFLVVAPAEEFLKMVAVTLHGYPRLGNAVGGAVLGAFAGLGFATVENFLYLSGALPFSYTELTGTAMARAGVSVGHVLWSAVAGYYIGLAKVVPEHRGALVLKGFVVAVVLHATYNSVTVAFFGVGTGAVAPTTWIPAVELGESAQVVFILVFYIGIGYYVLMKIERHRNAVSEIPGFG